MPWIIVTLALTLLIAAPTAVAEQTEMHPEVKKALEYRLRKNTCEPPKRRQSNVVSGQSRKMKKALEKYENCIIDYKKEIFEDFNQLKGSAQYGLTQDQADQILRKMAVIQKAIESKFGVPLSDEEVKERMKERAKRN